MTRTSQLLLVGIVFGGFGMVGQAEAKTGADAAREKMNAMFKSSRAKIVALPARNPVGAEIVAAGRSVKATSDAALRRGQMDRLVSEQKSQIRYCHERTASFSRRGTPSVALQLDVDRSGSVTAVRHGADRRPSELERCLVVRIKGWKFPAAAADASFDYLFVFGGSR